jgi:hypothetical protein
MDIHKPRNSLKDHLNYYLNKAADATICRLVNQIALYFTMCSHTRNQE